jgi:L-alanine-DL-glutamate epimerase-like enolase superfamily enzyme
MRITTLDLFAYDAPFMFGYHSAHLLRTQADSIIVAVRFDNGVTGYGESAPRPYVTGESPASVKTLFEQCLTPVLIGQEVGSSGDVERLLERLRQKCRRRGISQIQSALGAVDIALLDALGKSLHLPVCKLLDPERCTQIPWSIVIPMLPAAVIREFHQGISGHTFGSIKLLVGREEGKNEARTSLIRELFGSEISLRLEVNGNWTRKEAHANLRRLKGYGLAGIEQPVGKDDLEGLREIRETYGIPVIVDESMCSLEDAEALITGGACDILNIKISKVGGLLSAGRIASQAALHGVPCLLGSHVGETPILTHAALHFLVATPNLLLVEGFSSLLFGKVSKIDDLDPEPLIRKVIATPGLGVDPEKILPRDRLPKGAAAPAVPKAGISL